ncbi:MAG: hypothetical protein EOP45_18515 [Sphingobacteriaceae bacterium]|nr:MAG: hypothetical protein EOP45_18515 [Sphingobacteriaceae bacterium]
MTIARLSPRQMSSVSLLAVLTIAVLSHWAFSKSRWYFSILTTFIVASIIVWTLKHLYTHEHFEQNIDDSRSLKYGDAVCLFTLKNTFLKQNDTNPGLTQTPTLTRPEDLPSGSYKQLFIIEDSSQPAGPGNANPVINNSVICLVASNGQYVAAADNGNVVLQDNRCDGRCSFTIESEEMATTNILTTW